MAVVGAGEDPKSVRGRPLAYLLRAGYKGALYPVNPNRSVVQGLPAYPSVGALPAPPDVAVIVVPASSVAAVIDECGQVGTHAVVVLSGGFAEQGEAGAALQAEALAACRRGGIRMLGPNCLGAVNITGDLPLTFASYFATESPVMYPGNIALVSQSGSYATLAMDMAFHREIGLSHYVTTGNEADLQWADVVSELATRPEVSVVAGYLEFVKDGDRFRHALEVARDNGTQVVVLKSGRSPLAQQAAASHTGALAVNDSVFQAVLDKYGAQRVRDLSELVTVSRALAGPRPKGNRVALVTASGGLAAALADQAVESGLDLPPLSSGLRERLRAFVPDHACLDNPLDVADGLIQAPDKVLGDLTGQLLASDEVDMVGFFFGSTPYLEDEASRLLLQTAETGANALVCCWVGATGKFVRAMNHGGVIACDDPTQAIVSMQYLAAAARASRLGAPAATAPPTVPAGPVVSEFGDGDLLARLATAGLPVVERVCSPDADVILEHLRTSPASHMLKAHLPQVAHKSDVGAVQGPLRAGDIELAARFTAGFPAAELFEAQQAVKADWELIVGVHTDATFGPVAVVGLGGLLTNALRQAVTFVQPLEFGEFERRLRASTPWIAFSGYRNLAAANPREVFDLVLRLSQVATAAKLRTLELNPVMVEADTGRLVVVDAYGELTQHRYPRICASRSNAVPVVSAIE